MVVDFKSFISEDFFSNQVAKKIIKNNFTNSDGWKEKPAKIIQDWAL